MMISRTSAAAPRGLLPSPQRRPAQVRGPSVSLIKSTQTIPPQGLDWSASRAAKNAAGHGMRALMDTVKTAEASLLTLEGFKSAWVDTSIGPVHMLEAGERWDGPTWVFIHGFASQAADWSPLLRLLRPYCGRMLVLDLPGHGRSPVPTSGMTPDNLLRGCEEAVLGKLAADETCVLVGNSMGGLGVVRMTQKYPDRVIRPYLVQSAGAPSSEEDLDALIDTFEVHDMRKALQFVDKLFINGCATRWLIAAGVWAHMSREHLKVLLKAYRNYPKLTPAELQKMPPTCVISGDGDNFLPASSREFFKTHMPAGTAFAESDRFSHSPFLDLAHEIARIIVEDASRQPQRLIVG